MLLLIRPRSFAFNPQTAASNAYQMEDIPAEASSKALDEFNRLTQVLTLHHIPHVVEEDTILPPKPDAIFPNNWFSTHENGVIVLYPMEAENRRLERRTDIIDRLKEYYGYSEIIDLTHYEKEGKYLEGTGSLVFDRQRKEAYICESSRSNVLLARELCAKLGYELFAFDAVDRNGIPVYHTNVMMCVGKEFVAWAPEMIRDTHVREALSHHFDHAGKEQVVLTEDQVKAFAGNMLEVESEDGQNCLLLSSSARRSFTTEQIFQLRKYTSLLPVPVPVIERVGGGSVRCMVAEI
ncbi:MAG: amidinotransferase [Bacteroidetes bacterium]|nr:MAG: amidinotransferase [Bacteroidota bacterium]